MNNDVFTEGIERGGLTTDYEIRILICWLLSRIKTPVNSSLLSGALLVEGLVNYFEVTKAITLLLDSGHIKIETDKAANDSKDERLVLTELGAKTAESFYKNVPRSVRDKSLDAVGQYVLQERFARENKAEIISTDDGFRLELSLNDVGNDLMRISLYAPTREICEKMRDKFCSDPTELYRTVISSLLGEKLDIIKPYSHEG